MPWSACGTRRNFLAIAGVAATDLILTGCSGEARKKGNGETVPLTEALMREHGMLRRLIAVYGESVRRLDAHMELPPDVIPGAVDIIRSFIHKFHEVREEQDVFPHFEQAKRLSDLVSILRQQHSAGRETTELILRLATAGDAHDHEKRRKLYAAIHQFSRLYRAHTDREDTVLFPALREIVSPGRYRELSEKSEMQERKTFGDRGFEKMVGRVAALERMLSMEDLAGYSPEL